MPKLSDMIESKFLKQGDVGDGVLLTVSGVAQYNVAMQGAEQEMKWCMEFQGLDKPLVLNTTNMRIMEKLTNSDDTDDWIGAQVVLYADPNISFGGKIVGGIRIRAPKVKAAKPEIQSPPRRAPLPKEPDPAASDNDDSLRF